MLKAIKISKNKTSTADWRLTSG